MSEVERELQRDIALLEEVERGAAGPSFRTWRTDTYAVVIGPSVHIASEVKLAFCRSKAIPVLRRPSGGGAVLLGPGTLQYSFILPYSLCPMLRSIASSKRFCNTLLLEALPAGQRLGQASNGDLISGNRKVGGLALKRKRSAMLLHGSLLLTADLELLAATLTHPAREPAYRRGRDHRQFLTNLGPLTAGDDLDHRVQTLLAEIAEGRLGLFPTFHQLGQFALVDPVR